MDYISPQKLCELIEWYKKKTNSWKLCKDKIVKVEEWVYIADRMNITVTKVQKLVRTLETMFHNERNNLDYSTILTCCSSELCTQNDCVMQAENVEEITNSQQLNENTFSTNDYNGNTECNNLKNNRTDINTNSNVIEETNARSKNYATEEECFTFTKSIGIQLKRLPNIYFFQTINEIQNLVSNKIEECFCTCTRNENASSDNLSKRKRRNSVEQTGPRPVLGPVVKEESTAVIDLTTNDNNDSVEEILVSNNSPIKKNKKGANYDPIVLRSHVNNSKYKKSMKDLKPNYQNNLELCKMKGKSRHRDCSALDIKTREEIFEKFNKMTSIQKEHYICNMVIKLPPNNSTLNRSKFVYHLETNAGILCKVCKKVFHKTLRLSPMYVRSLLVEKPYDSD